MTSVSPAASMTVADALAALIDTAPVIEPETVATAATMTATADAAAQVATDAAANAKLPIEYWEKPDRTTWTGTDHSWRPGTTEPRLLWLETLRAVLVSAHGWTPIKSGSKTIVSADGTKRIEFDLPYFARMQTYETGKPGTVHSAKGASIDALQVASHAIWAWLGIAAAPVATAAAKFNLTTARELSSKVIGAGAGTGAAPAPAAPAATKPAQAAAPVASTRTKPATTREATDPELASFGVPAPVDADYTSLCDGLDGMSTADLAAEVCRMARRYQVARVRWHDSAARDKAAADAAAQAAATQPAPAAPVPAAPAADTALSADAIQAMVTATVSATLTAVLPDFGKAIAAAVKAEFTQPA